MSDTVVFGADASAYFDVVARMQQKLDELSSHTGQFNNRLGDQSGVNGFLRGEYRVERQAKLLTQGLLEARSASDALSAGLQAAVFSTKLPLAAGLGAIVIAEGLKIVLDQAARTKKAYDDLATDMAKPIGQQIHQSAEAIKSDLASELTHFSALRKELD